MPRFIVREELEVDIYPTKPGAHIKDGEYIRIEIQEGAVEGFFDIVVVGDRGYEGRICEEMNPYMFAMHYKGIHYDIDNLRENIIKENDHYRVILRKRDY